MINVSRWVKRERRYAPTRPRAYFVFVFGFELAAVIGLRRTTRSTSDMEWEGDEVTEVVGVLRYGDL